MIAQLHTPVVDQERMTNVASATLLPSSAGPEPADTDFGLAVSDDRSLDENLIAFSLERATTSGDLFLQIAEAASARDVKSMPTPSPWSRPCSATAGRPTSCVKRWRARGRLSA